MLSGDLKLLLALEEVLGLDVLLVFLFVFLRLVLVNDCDVLWAADFDRVGNALPIKYGSWSLTLLRLTLALRVQAL